MNISAYTASVTLLTITTASLAVVPLVTSANHGDTTVITNTAYSEVTTGGKSSHGADGADGRDGTDGAPGQSGQDGADGVDGRDGEDGKDGRDGADGQAGVSISNFSFGGERASVQVESSINGETVLDIHEEFSNEATNSAAVHSAAQSEVQTDTAATASVETSLEAEAEAEPVSTFTRIKNAFVSFQLTILSYVSFIF
jgi:hypothetical protein